MTRQVSEFLYIENERHGLFARPLDPFLDSSQSRPKFQIWSTSCHRGYIGHWELKEKRLYLLRIEGYLGGRKTCLLPVVFPDATHPVFAKWYSGTLRVPLGKIVAAKNMGYTDVHEDELRIKVRNGVAVASYCLKETVYGRLLLKLKSWLAKQMDI